MMRFKFYGGFLAAATILLGGWQSASAQVQDVGVPGQASRFNPLPTDSPDQRGVFTFGEFMILTQSWGLGKQTVAVRGLVDSRGAITGLPGTYIGSGVNALSTDDFPRRSYQPGFQVGVGYKFEDGTSVHLSYMNLLSQNYHAGATLAAPFFRSRPDLSDTFLTAGVFNFPPQYAGPLVKTVADDTNSNGTADPGEGGNFYGIWNGASVMDIQFNQWFTQWEIGARVPLFQTEYSRIYALAGARMDWFMERFRWRTVSYDVSGQAGNRDAATYNNTLSQRMYGPYIGCGHEIYLRNGFSLSLDTTAAVLLNVIKQRAKYVLDSREIQNKMSRDEFGIVPSVTANLNLWWNPLDGVQMRVGYNGLTFFGTQYMQDPIGFNYGSIDPVYETKVFRLVHGVNVGLGLFF